MDWHELERRVRALGDSMTDRLTVDQATWLADLIDAGEYGQALEFLADWLCEEASPISASELAEATALSTLTGNADRVTGPLLLCPLAPM